ncbi:alpha/beta hydrolase [Streptomyces winkii]|uniref:alpha/beta hydrolase n=1 Tax=Streptomyces winkii TaxID=3051178 RepID=UPI0028D53E88|nr:alpha/beta hydrolase [Streptomyces sp. DSM 40971]
MTLARPGIDPELHAQLDGMPLSSRLDPEMLEELRRQPSPPVDDLLKDRAADRREITIPGPDGTRIPLSVFSPAGTTSSSMLPCVYWLHGGGMVMGNRFWQIDIPLEWLDLFGAVVVSADYRLAPESTGSAPLDDSYQGLLWIAEHAGELGVDPDRIVVAGASAGGGLAAGVTLTARDRGTPAVAAQVLIGPMLDHRNDTVSSRQYSGVPAVWTREKNAFAWRSLLGGDARDEEVPRHVSPALADDLSGLPPTYIDAGSAEVYRDEDVEYATRIWAAGGQAELHVWAGGFHGFDALFPHVRVSEAARRTRNDWLGRVLNPAGQT